MEEKLVVIGGGVGPMAGVVLHDKIIKNTKTDGTDQTHLEVMHLSRSHDIPDRTEYLLGSVKDSPAEGMATTMKMAANAALLAGKSLVAGVPCNTFHAPQIFSEFLVLMKEPDLSKLEVVHMLDETAALIESIVPKAKNIGLMSTTGTRAVSVYNAILEPRGFKLLEVPNGIQADLHDSIYNKDWGIKAVSPVTEQARKNFESYCQLLADQGAEAIILGCTEIPLALPEADFKGIPLIDPMLALARALIKRANPDKLKTL